MELVIPSYLPSNTPAWSCRLPCPPRRPGPPPCPALYPLSLPAALKQQPRGITATPHFSPTLSTEQITPVLAKNPFYAQLRLLDAALKMILEVMLALHTLQERHFSRGLSPSFPKKDDFAPPTYSQHLRLDMFIASHPQNAAAPFYFPLASL